MPEIHPDYTHDNTIPLQPLTGLPKKYKQYLLTTQQNSLICSMLQTNILEEFKNHIIR